MRRISGFLAMASLLVLPLAVGCGDDEDPAENGSGATGASTGKGGTGGNTGKGGNTGEAGEGGAGNTSAGGGDTGGATSDGGVGGMGAVHDPCEGLPNGGVVPPTGTLESGNCYELDGLTKVITSLTIEPGVRIVGDAEDDILVIMPGATIDAEGTEDEPIVFTSGAESPAPGDWGGLLILGNDVCNDAVTGTLCEIEGLTDGTTFGNTAADAVTDDDSGTLAYVRIEYSGVDIDGQGNEINGLTLGGVGSGTTIHHVQVANTLDDCFEWFGGSVNADHLIAWNCGDDMFDTDSGFSGHVQFVFGRQVNTITSDPNGFEMDNDKTTFDKAPISSPQFSNVTLCGTGEASAANPHVGMVLRNGTHGALMNAIVTGFATAAFSVRNTPDTAITLTNSIAFGNTAEVDGDHAAAATWFTDEATNSASAPADFGDCWADPPAPFPAAEIAGGTPAGHGDESAAFVGAFADADDNWMTGAWVSWN